MIMTLETKQHLSKNGLSYGGDDKWALKREMTGNVAASQQTTGNKKFVYKSKPCRPQCKWDRGFYPFIDLSSFMQPFVSAR